jgi:hypothetical protein
MTERKIRMVTNRRFWMMENMTDRRFWVRAGFDR